MQNVATRIGEALLVFAVLGILVVLALERLVTYRRYKHEKKTRSFLDIINPR
jgi:hypothetical protein